MAWHISKALYEKWRSSQGPEGASLAESCSDGNAFAPSNGNPTPQLYLPPDRMKAFSRLSRFGMTFAPLTEDRGADLLTWYREAFLAKTSAQPERARGITGERSGMWKEMARIIGEVRPRYVLVENSPVLTSRGLDRVLGDLALLGYDAEWIVLGADDAGAPHRRKRIWILGHDAKRQLADPDLRGCLYGQSQKQSAKGGIDAQCFVGAGGEDVSDTNDHGLQGGVFQRGIDQLIRNRSNRTAPQHRTSGRPELHTEGWWTVEPAVGRVANGVAARVDRLKAIGNGQVPAVVRLAWHILHERLKANEEAQG